MPQPIYLYERHTKDGLPRLTLKGPSLSWTAQDVECVEEQLKKRYDVLTRDGGTISFSHRGQTLFVRRMAGDTSRLPTLEIFTTDPAIAPDEPVDRPLVRPASEPAATPRGWFADWLADVEAALFAADGRLDEAERAMSRVVLNELAAHRAKPPTKLAVEVFAAVLADLERHGQCDGKPNKYTFVLSGVEKLLDPTYPTPRGPLADGGPAARWWFARILKGVCG